MTQSASGGQSPKQVNVPLTTPFAKIALAFSGGGFRAASFSLGTLGYLNAVNFLPGQTLLNNTRFISSASGGTITNATYALSLFSGQSFEQFYHNLRQLLEGEALLKEVLEILNNDSEWQTGDAAKSRTLINAFAMVYDRRLFNHAVMGDIWYRQNGPKLSVCFNATEFYKGMSFRFQTPADEDHSGYWGNNYLRITPENKAVYKKIKLGDMLAASSCFPAGFEPILYPRDFTYPAANGSDGLTKTELQAAMSVYEFDKSHKTLDKTVAMMDGGITDNQGLYSAMRADDRERKSGSGYDLIMSSDVASYFMDASEPPVEKPATGWRKKNISYYISKAENIFSKLKWIAAVTGAAMLAAFLMVAIAGSAVVAIAGYILMGITATVLLLLLFVIVKANKNPLIKALTSESGNSDIGDLLKDVNIGNAFSPSIIDKLTYYFSRTRLNALELMLKARLSSMLTMVLDINLKQVRRLIYELFYENKQWQDRRSQNAIYDISTFNKNNRRFRIEKKEIERLDGTTTTFTAEEKELLLNGCEAMEAIAEAARNMGTTLWFDETDKKSDMLKKIICCGHFTTCANLLEYVMVLEKRGLTFAPEVAQQLQDIRTQITAHWIKFKADPYFLY
jgi:predicted acylesterase/phospholipase RssA